MEKFIVGIDLGGTSAKLGIFTPDLYRISSSSFSTAQARQGQDLLADLVDGLLAAIEAAGLDAADCLGIGMGTPGAVDRQAGQVAGAYNLGWTASVPVAQAFQTAFPGCPFYLENDANVAALGEYQSGAGEDYDNLVFVTLGTGIGGGIICQGQLLLGGGTAGEIGHICADPSSEAYLCTCGRRGCIETIASATGIVRLAQDQAENWIGESELALTIRSGAAPSCREIFNAVKSSDSFAQAVTSWAMDKLGLVLSQVAVTVDPEAIVLGGGVAQAGEILLDLIRPSLEAHTYQPILAGLDLKLASLGPDAGMLGAASLVKNDQAAK